LLRYGLRLSGSSTPYAVDQLSFNYTGNQLSKVTDTGTNSTLSTSYDFRNYATNNTSTTSATVNYVGNKEYKNLSLQKIYFGNGYYNNVDKKYYFYIRII
jgi:hypothetical protein